MLSFDMLIYDREKELLNAQKKVLAQWINQTLNKDDITTENFMHVLDNGVILCNLIRVIQYKAEQNCKNGLTTGVIPSTKFRCWENAKSQSFFARDNTENFLKWCRSFGVNEAVIFESDGLVRHTQPRNVVLCLLELGRLASRFGIPPPASVRLEKNGEDQDYGTTSESESVSSVSYYYTSHQRMDATMCVTNTINSGPTPEHQSPRPRVQKRSFIPIRNHIKLSDLDKRVLQITAKVLQDKDQLKKVSDGLYTIRGKNVFVKLLKDNHVVVRVGGGWDNLDHFLSHHSPQQVKSSSQKVSAPGNGCARSPTYVVDSGTAPRLVFQNKTKHRGPFFTIPRSPKHKCC
ncbi:growth arrest-specific protein 2-like isoform X2 [Tachypleus tridentatus]|uniref:growth arrest-specific protein 2-like isoform X2 n=1 Tax=Tachypleus tridentatus TaxID=6853 RepID=UPI003FD46C35